MVALVKDIMTKDVVTVPENASIKEALAVMKENDISSLLVSCEEDRPFGIVTRRDMINALVIGKKSKDAKVSEIMSAPLILATPNLRVEDAAALMLRCGVRRLPVLRKGAIVGIVSNSDIFRHVLES